MAIAASKPVAFNGKGLKQLGRGRFTHRDRNTRSAREHHRNALGDGDKFRLRVNDERRRGAKHRDASNVELRRPPNHRRCWVEFCLGLRAFRSDGD